MRVSTRSRWLVAGLMLAIAAVAFAGVIGLGQQDEAADQDGPSVTGTTATTVPEPTIPTAPERPTTEPAPTEPAATTTTTTPTTTEVPLAGPAVVVRHGSGDRPVVAVTFDAGSDAGATTRILDLLAERGVPASFGLTGSWVEAHPDLTRRIVGDGHAVINHTQNHPSFTGFSTRTAPISRELRQSELREAEDAIRRLGGADPRPWFRPPYGDYDDSVLADVGAVGYRYVVMWSIDSLGWQGRPASEVAARTVAALEPGAIVLMHVGSASTDVDALPAVLDAIDRLGLQPVTVTELVGIG